MMFTSTKVNTHFFIDTISKTFNENKNFQSMQALSPLCLTQVFVYSLRENLKLPRSNSLTLGHPASKQGSLPIREMLCQWFTLQCPVRKPKLSSVELPQFSQPDCFRLSSLACLMSSSSHYLLSVTSSSDLFNSSSRRDHVATSGLPPLVTLSASLPASHSLSRLSSQGPTEN